MGKPGISGGGGGGKKGNDPPAAPNYVGAANATSQGSIQAALVNNLLNTRNTTSPLGSQTFSQSGTQSIPGVGDQPGFSIPTYDQNITMSPEQQGLYDQQMSVSRGLMGLGQNSLDQTTKSLGQPQDLSSVQDIADRSYSAQTARLDPQWAQRKGEFDAQMANQGITAGGEAYDNAARDFGQQRNDAYTQARQQAISTMPQTYQLSTAQRMQPLAELNAIRTGSQPQMPQFQAVPTAGGAQGPNLLGAAGQQGQWDQGMYNAQTGQQNSKNSGMMSIAGAAAAFF